MTHKELLLLAITNCSEDECTKFLEQSENIGSISSALKKANRFIDVEYLMTLHPELTKEEAQSLKEYSNAQTIHLKVCYGNGSIIYSEWKKQNALNHEK